MRSTSPDVTIPDVTITDYVLRHAARLGDRPALIDGPDRPHAHLPPAGSAARGARPRRWPSAASARATCSPSTARTARVRHRLPRRRDRAAASSPPSTRSTPPTSWPTSSRTPARASCSPCRPSSRRRRKARQEARRRGDLRLRRGRRGAALRGAARRARRSAARGRDQPGRGPRRAALLERHHRPAEGRDAHAPQPGRQHLPDRGLRLRALRRAGHARSAVLPFFHIYGMVGRS